MKSVPRGKCGSPKESQKQKLAQRLLWLWGRGCGEMLQCLPGCACVGNHGNRAGWLK